MIRFAMGDDSTGVRGAGARETSERRKVKESKSRRVAASGAGRVLFAETGAVESPRGAPGNRKLGTRSPTTPVFRQKSAGVIEKRGVKSLGSAKECVSA